MFGGDAIMKRIVFPDYSHSILNVSNSILKHYGAKPFHPTLSYLDKQLAKNYRNVVLILVDALGEDALSHHLPKNSMLRSHMSGTLTSVFPPTTVAATTAVLSGKTPIETGWIGWHQYVSEVDRSVVFFMNKDYYDPTHVFGQSIAQTVVPYTNLYQLIAKASPDVATHEIFPAFRTPENDTFAKLCQAIKTAIQPDGRHFVYAYWDKVDSLMHEFGPYAQPVHDMIESVELGFADLVINSPEDTLFMVIADHGQVDVDPIYLYDYPDIEELLIRKPSIESRASVFYVKKGMESLFEERFNHHFRRYFNLYKTEDALKMKLFGDGKEHPRTREFLGDYIAIAIHHFNLVTQKDSFVMKGQHAGLLEAEMMVPLIIHSPKK